MNILAFLATSCVLVLWGFTIWGSQKAAHIKRNQNRSRSGEHERQDGETSGPPEVAPRKRDAEGQKKQRPPRKNWHPTPRKWDGPSISQATIGVGLFVMAGAQIIVYSKQTTIMGTQAAIADAANKLSAATQRPFIVFSTEKTTVPDGWHYTLVVKNTGNTPTKNLHLIFATPIENSNLLKPGIVQDRYKPDDQALASVEPEIGAPRDPADLFDPTTLIFRKVENFQGVVGPKDQIKLDALNNNITRAPVPLGARLNPSFFYGEARYYNTIGDDKLYVTKFCYNLTAITISAGNDVIPISASCRFWNCADDECENDKRSYEWELQMDEMMTTMRNQQPKR